MDGKIDKALQRLNQALPLKARQDACSDEIKALHQHTLRSFVMKGRILTREEMARYVGNVDEAIDVLKTNDMVVFSDTGEPVGAYPFTMEEREHKVHVNGHDVHAMCALDALSISPMFDLPARISSVCRVTGEPVYIEQSGAVIENEAQAGGTQFGISWGSASANACVADSLCMDMIFLKDTGTAREWLAQGQEDRQVFALPEAVEFGARFFVPLMS